MTKQREIHTADMPIGQKPDVDISLDAKIIHGESLPNIGHEHEVMEEHARNLAFMEEPMLIRIEENTRSDFPETHVPVSVQGEGAEILMNGKWVRIEWLPIGQPITTKRKYVEVLARSKTETVRVSHDGPDHESPRNFTQRRNSAQYPLSILQDNNPRGHEWLSRIMMGH